MRLSISLLLILTSLMSSAQVIVGPTTGQNGTTPKALLDVRASNPAAPLASDGFLLPRLEYFPDADQVPQGIQEGTLMLYMPTGTPDEGRVPGGVYVYTELEAWELLSQSGDGIDDDGDAPCVAGITNNTGVTELNCNTTQISLTGTGGDTYSWSNGISVVSTSAGLTVSNPGSYTLTITTESGCTDTASIVITQDITAPIAVIDNNTGTTELTSGVPVIVVEASGGETYLWHTGETTAQLTITEAGTYTVTVTASNGCTDTESIVITEEGGCPNVGDYIAAEAGVVFWVASDCSSYKIVSLVNLSHNGDPTRDWGPTGSLVYGANSDSDGAQNTQDWINNYSNNGGNIPGNMQHYFPYLAYSFSAGSGSGWYLGAPDEYTTLRNNRSEVQSGINDAQNVGADVDNITWEGYYFWTSKDEYGSEDNAYRIRWSDGEVRSFPKRGEYDRWGRAFKEIQL